MRKTLSETDELGHANWADTNFQFAIGTPDWNIFGKDLMIVQAGDSD
jgi:hypothetical protein